MMIIILFATALGILFSYLGLQNPQSTSIHLFDYTLTLPTYLFGAIALVTGIVISFIVSIFNSLGTFASMRRKDRQIHAIATSEQELKHSSERLIAENIQLKEELDSTRKELRGEKIETQKEQVKNFFGRIRNGFAT